MICLFNNLSALADTKCSATGVHWQLLVTRKPTIRPGAAVKMQVIRFIFNKTPCGSAVAVVTVNRRQQSCRILLYFVSFRLHIRGFSPRLCAAVMFPSNRTPTRTELQVSITLCPLMLMTWNCPVRFWQGASGTWSEYMIDQNLLLLHNYVQL